MLSMLSILEDLVHGVLQIRHFNAFFRLGDCCLLRFEVKIIN